MVGKRGFEPPTPSPPAMCATRLRYFPNYFLTVAAINKGTIITRVIGIDGLNNQYSNPIAKISSHTSFFLKIVMMVIKLLFEKKLLQIYWSYTLLRIIQRTINKFANCIIF